MLKLRLDRSFLFASVIRVSKGVRFGLALTSVIPFGLDTGGSVGKPALTRLGTLKELPSTQ